MILNSLQLSNFRGFYGKTPLIRFNDSKDSSVTLLHAVNGAGKTTFLNALTWVLYDSTNFTSGNLINRQVFEEKTDGEDVACWVELSFTNREHGENVKYFLRREMVVRKKPGQMVKGKSVPSRLTMQQKLGSGESVQLDSTSSTRIINRIIPSELSKYFFFEGENPAKLGNPNREQKRKIAEATKRLLGIGALDRAIKHLKSATGLLEKELGKVGPLELQKLISDKEDAVNKLEDLVEAIDNNENQISAHKDSIATIRQELSNSKEAKDLEHEREKFEKLKTKAEIKQIELRVQLKSHFSKYGINSLFSSVLIEFEGITTLLREKGELPKGIKQQFIDDLVAAEKCICGTPLHGASIARERVLEWRTKAGLPEAEEKVLHLVAMMQDINDKKDEFEVFVYQKQNDLRQLSDTIDDYEHDIEDIREKLISSDVEIVAGLEEQLAAEEDLRDELNREIGRQTKTNKELKKLIDDLSKEIEQLGKRERINDSILTRIEVAKLVEGRTIEWKEKLSHDFRQTLEKSIQSIYDDITVVPYKVVVNDDFSVDLVTDDSNKVEVEPSRGESQVLSLAFLGGIIEETRRYYKKAGNIGMSDFIQYPIVMDAPFGQLDSAHRRHVASRLSGIADQIVVLVTPTQYRGEVQEAMGTIIGKQYLMKYFTTRSDFNSRNPKDYQVEINGAQYNLVEKSDTGFEYSIIVSI